MICREKMKRNPKHEEIMENIIRALQKRSSKSSNITKELVLNERRECKELNEAFDYYVKNRIDYIHVGLISLACEAVNGNPDDSIPVQVIMLLLTAAIDIHDDIIDGSRTKYGKPTVFSKFGKDIALLVGDAFLIKGLTLLHRLKEQISAEKIDAIWEIIIGNGKQSEIDSLRNYGRTLGILTGIREDFIDIFEPDELQNRMKNELLPLPILYAFKNPQTKKIILNYLSKPRITNKDSEKIVEIISEDRNIRKLRNEIQELSKQALKHISIVPNSGIKSQMQILVNGVLENL